MPRHVDEPDAVVVGEPLVPGVVQDLQAPEIQEEQEENENEGRHGDGDLLFDAGQGIARPFGKGIHGSVSQAQFLFRLDTEHRFETIQKGMAQEGKKGVSGKAPEEKG